MRARVAATDRSRPSTPFRVLSPHPPPPQKTPSYHPTTPNRKLEAALRPTSLTIINESHKHAGHSGNPTGAADAETHFRVEVVSSEFEGKRLVQRHQAVYRLLDDEIKAGVHALSMDTRTPDEEERK